MNETPGYERSYDTALVLDDNLYEFLQACIATKAIYSWHLSHSVLLLRIDPEDLELYEIELILGEALIVDGKVHLVFRMYEDLAAAAVAGGYVPKKF